MEVSKIHHSWSPQFLSSIAGQGLQLGTHYAMDESLPTTLESIGVGFCRGVMDDMIEAHRRYGNDFGIAMDANNIQQSLTASSLSVPLQFLQGWLPGYVGMTTAPLMIDEVIGLTTIGTWADEQIVQQVLELSGSPVPYSDRGVVPLTDWQVNYAQRTVVRMELGMSVGKLEQERSARARIDSADQKRISTSLQLDINRNQMGFFGYNANLNQTYGYLNDPNLPAYVTVAIGATSAAYTWAAKTADEIQADLLTAFAGLRTQSLGRIDPGKTPLTLNIATNCIDYLNKTSNFMMRSVREWLEGTYKNVRIVNAPQLDGANGGSNVFIIHADTVNDGLSTDDRKTFIQLVPSKLQFLGIGVTAKEYTEDYVSASAGIMCKRPYAVYRASGI